MSFDRLPDETLVEIINCVGHDGLVSSFRNLAIVNRTLHRIVTPLLYEQFTEASTSSAPRFLRAVLANPQLAEGVRSYKGYGLPNPAPENFVRTMDMLWPGQKSKSEMSGKFLDLSGFQEGDFDRLQETMKRLGCQDRTEWISDIRKGQWHAVTSMILLLLTNLENFEVEDYRDDAETGHVEYALGIAARLQKYAFTRQFALKHLTTVSLAGGPHPSKKDDPVSLGPSLWSSTSSETGYLYISDVLPFLKLSSVQSMSISRLAAVEGCGRTSAEYLAGSPEISITDLEMTDSVLEMGEFESFLRSFSCIRRLSYEHVAAREDFLPQEIGKSISHLKHCLEELDISSEVEENGYNTSPQQIGSLAGFDKLRRIDLAGPDLLGYPNWEDGATPDIKLINILPKSLETLVVGASDSQGEERHLRELLAAKEKDFPYLKRVKVKWRGIHDPEGMKRDFIAKGVKLTL